MEEIEKIFMTPEQTKTVQSWKRSNPKTDQMEKELKALGLMDGLSDLDAHVFRRLVRYSNGEELGLEVLKVEKVARMNREDGDTFFCSSRRYLLYDGVKL